MWPFFLLRGEMFFPLGNLTTRSKANNSSAAARNKSWVNKAYNNKTIARKLIELNRQRTEAATIKAASNGAFLQSLLVLSLFLIKLLR